MITLGISAYYHDSAAALVRDGEVVAAIQQERFSRRKADSEFPAASVEYCLKDAGVSLDEVDYVAFYDKPILTFDRLLETYLAFAPKGMASFVKSMPIWMKQKLLVREELQKKINKLGSRNFPAEKILFSFHHHSHAASAFYLSPFDRAAILVIDGVGEWATTSLGRGSDTDIDLFSEIRFPHSLGMLYAAFTYYLGFKINDGEYKVMGMAPYGEPIYASRITEHLLDLKEDGSFRLDMQYFDYCVGLTMTNARFDELFDGVPPRRAGEPLTKRHMDLARSIQHVTEEVMLRLVRTLHRETGERNLCMAGGVALNCVANGRILREGPFERIWIQPASGDAGGALGAALAAGYAHGTQRPLLGSRRDGMAGGYLGPEYGADAIHAVLKKYGAVYHEFDDARMIDAVVSALADEKVIGWFQGRMEFGPRALGNRSILADARSPRMQRILNMKIKYRESFRPFAPAVLGEVVGDYFDLAQDSPYMLLVAQVRSERHRKMTDAENALEGINKLNIVRSDIPAVTHVDYSARVQTVHEDTNPQFYKLLKSFEIKTGYGVLVNTSFNIRDEPIVCSPEDAYRCFMGTEMDVLTLGNTILYKEEQ